MSANSDMIKVGEWSDQHKFKPIPNRPDRQPARNDFERNRTYIVTTIIEEPYIMLKKGKLGQVIEDRDKYIGYCKDLADILAKRLGIKCKYKSTIKSLRWSAKHICAAKKLLFFLICQLVNNGGQTKTKIKYM